MCIRDSVLGAQFQEAIASIDHWIAFVLLALIGGNMIHEALDNDEEEADASLDVKTMFLLAVATSIDALAIGTVSYTHLDVYKRQVVLGDAKAEASRNAA